MTDRPVFAADRLDQVEDQQSEHVTWLVDIANDVDSLTAITLLHQDALCHLLDAIRPLTIPATQGHLSFQQALEAMTMAQLHVEDYKLRLQAEMVNHYAQEPGTPSPLTPEPSLETPSPSIT